MDHPEPIACRWLVNREFKRTTSRLLGEQISGLAFNAIPTNSKPRDRRPCRIRLVVFWTVGTWVSSCPKMLRSNIAGVSRMNLSLFKAHFLLHCILYNLEFLHRFYRVKKIKIIYYNIKIKLRY